MKPTFSAILVCVGVGTFMSRLDAYIVSVALPAMGEAFGRDMGSMSGVMLFYLLAIASSMLIIGRLGDSVGLRRTLLAGYGLFSIMSLLCSFTPGLNVLVAARFLQGVGAALLLVASYALVSTTLKANQVGSAMGVMNMVGSLGVLLGAPLGGVMTQWLGWESIFLVNVPLGLVAMGLCWYKLPKDDATWIGLSSFDWFGGLLSMVGLWAVVLGFDFLRRENLVISAVVWVAIGVICLLAFVWYERRTAVPLVDLGLFRNSVFRYALLAKVFAFLQMSAHGYVMPFYLDWSRGYTTQGSGAVLAIFPIVLSLVAPLAGRLSDRNEGRLPPAVLTTLGMCGTVVASGFFVATLALDSNWPAYAFLGFSGLSYGFFLSPNAKLILTNVPEQSRAVGTSIFTTATNVGMALGVPMAVLLFHAAGGESLTSHNFENLEGFKYVYTANALCGLTAAGFAFASLRSSCRQQ